MLSNFWAIAAILFWSCVENFSFRCLALRSWCSLSRFSYSFLQYSRASSKSYMNESIVCDTKFSVNHWSVSISLANTLFMDSRTWGFASATLFVRSFLKSGSIGYPDSSRFRNFPMPLSSFIFIVSRISECRWVIISCLLSSMNLGGVMRPETILSGNL